MPTLLEQRWKALQLLHIQALLKRPQRAEAHATAHPLPRKALQKNAVAVAAATVGSLLLAKARKVDAAKGAVRVVVKIAPHAKHVKAKMAHVNLAQKEAIAGAEGAATAARQEMANVPKVPELKARAAPETVKMARAMRARAPKAVAHLHRAVVADATAPALALALHRRQAAQKRAKSDRADQTVHHWVTAPRPAKNQVPTRKKGAGWDVFLGAREHALRAVARGRSLPT